MHLFFPREKDAGETRAPLVPSTAAKLVKLGAEVEVERGLGETIFQRDEDYRGG